MINGKSWWNVVDVVYYGKRGINRMTYFCRLRWVYDYIIKSDAGEGFTIAA